MLFVKCLLLLFVLYETDAAYTTRSCSTPRLRHGRARTRQRSKMVKFICFPGYELVGNKYATCKNGEWDEPFPVCVRPGCKPIPKPDNGLQLPSHRGAWILTFCLPGYTLSGSSAVFCDGVTWNATAPVCVESKAPTLLSCDFEDPDICGWTQDDLHDFDWKRQNLHTPSHFLNTGPAFDHSYGRNGNGYYMYIESTSKLENDTARLLSPIYSSALAKNGCFSFFYHMYGKTTGGLKVYQKPDNIALQALLQLPSVDQKKYLLFEKWGDQGDTWFRSVDSLSDFNDNFQIVIEGIRGPSFTSDIAIDDVAILQGDNCTAAREAAVTPREPESDSCVGRCDVFGGTKGRPSSGCHCNVDCFIEDNCCADFFEICVFEETTDSLPQTQKLVASTTPTAEMTTTTVAPPPPYRPGIPSIAPPPTQLPSRRSTPSHIPDWHITHALPTPETPQVSTTTTTPAPEITTQNTTHRPPTSTPTIKTTSKGPPTLVFRSTTAIYNATGRIKKDNSTVKPVGTTSTARPVARNSTKSPIKVTNTTKRVVTTVRPMEKVTASKIVRKAVVENDVESQGLRTGIIVITSLVLLAGLAWVIVWSRGAQGRSSIARLRGRTTSHPEVRFLTAHEDDEAQ